MTPGMPAAALVKSVDAAWQALVDQISNRHGDPRIKYGPKYTPDGSGGRPARVGAVWFLAAPGRPAPVNHNLSISEYANGPSWVINAGRHGGLVTNATLRARDVFPVEMLRFAAVTIGLLPAPPDTDAEDLDTIREIAARAQHNGEPIDPGVLLDIVGWPTAKLV
jgi:hypothetical protein